MAFEDTGQHERAKADIESTLDRNVLMVSALYIDRGYRLTKSRNYDKAIAAFDKSI